MHELGVKNQLFSYYYMRDLTRKRGGSEKLRDMLTMLEAGAKLGYRYFLDSGAFTFQVQLLDAFRKFTAEACGLPPADTMKLHPYDLLDTCEKYGVTPALDFPPVEEYFRDYLEFVKVYGHLFFIIAELDIEGCYDGKQDIVPLSKVDGWTNDLLATRHALRVMPVYHESRGIPWLRDWLCDTHSPYVGLGSDPTRGDTATALIAHAHRFGKWIHGFGQAALKSTLKKRPFDSVDASTWLRADKYGGSFLLREAVEMVDGEARSRLFGPSAIQILTHKEKNRRREFADFYRRWGLDINKIMGDDPYPTHVALEDIEGSGGRYKKAKLVAQSTQESLVENRKATLIAWREIAKYYESLPSRAPKLWEMACEGRMPDEHPYITARKNGRSIQLWA